MRILMGAVRTLRGAQGPCPDTWQCILECSTCCWTEAPCSSHEWGNQFLFLQYPCSNPRMGDLQGIAVSVLDVRGTWIGVGERLAPTERSPECTMVLLSPNRDGGCHSLPQNATGCAHLTLTPLYPCPGPHRRGEGHDRSWASTNVTQLPPQP